MDPIAIVDIIASLAMKAALLARQLLGLRDADAEAVRQALVEADAALTVALAGLPGALAENDRIVDALLQRPASIAAQLPRACGSCHEGTVIPGEDHCDNCGEKA